MVPGLVPAMMLAGVAGIPTLTAISNVTDEIQYNSQTSLAQITIASIGDIINETTSLGSYDNGDWIDPKQGMDQFSVRWTDGTGTINVGTAGAWQALTSSRTFGCTIGGGGGSKTAIGTLEIARTDDTTTVLATKANITIRATSSPLTPP
jgi:hypothetical protein